MRITGGNAAPLHDRQEEGKDPSIPVADPRRPSIPFPYRMNPNSYTALRPSSRLHCHIDLWEEENVERSLAARHSPKLEPEGKEWAVFVCEMCANRFVRGATGRD